MIDVVMPQMGESIVEGTLTKWLKKAGDRVELDEPLFEISTDKVDTEIPAPTAGTLSEVLVQEGATVAIHTVVARIDESGAGGGAAAPAAEAPAAPAPAAAPPPAAAASSVPSVVPASSAPAPSPSRAEQARTRLEPMSTMRQKIAEHMVMSKNTSVHVTTVHKVDVTKIAKLRDRNKGEFQAR